MIFAVEGPDCAGKTTLFERLKPMFQRAVRLPPFNRRDISDDLGLRDLAAVEALVDPSEVYLFDRFPPVSAWVYAHMYGRPVPDVSRWLPCTIVLLLLPDVDTLRRRAEARGETLDRPELALRVYRSIPFLKLEIP